MRETSPLAKKAEESKKELLLGGSSQVTETTQHEKKVVVDRTKWGRGKEDGSLRNEAGLMCCLGFACLQHGATEAQITNFGMPSRLDRTMLDEDAFNAFIKPDPLGDNTVENQESTTFANRAAGINDSSIYASDTSRESDLIELFTANGWTIEFVN